MNNCKLCRKEIEDNETYEYRGALSCSDCFDEVIKGREFERREIITEEQSKTDKLKGLDLSLSTIGKENRKILKSSIEIASKESIRLKMYEGRQ